MQRLRLRLCADLFPTPYRYPYRYPTSNPNPTPNPRGQAPVVRMLTMSPNPNFDPKKGSGVPAV